jgi:type I restriction enzyme, S subunit
MSRYETYKPSGIDWIGNYPKHWEFSRLKNVCIVNKEALTDKTPFDYLIEYIDIGNTTDNGEFLELQEIEFSEAPSRARRKVEDGDTIISTVRTYLRAIAFIENPKENLIVSTGFAVLNPIKKTLVPKFLFYQVLCDSFIQRVIANSEGVSYPAISSTKLADLKLFIPSVEEQLTIANYLDDQTQKIVRLITNKKAQAEKLKELRQIEINNAVTKGLNPNAEMKDTGIEWLGKIPKHWEKRKIATNFQIIGSGTTPDAGNEEYYDETGKYYFVNTGDLKDCEIYDCEKKITEEAFTKFTSLKLFPVNTLLIAMYGATIGKVGILKTEATTNQACCALANSYRFNIDYMFYFFIGIREDIIRLSYGGGQPNISQDTIKQLRIPCPPKDEQLQIVEHLQKRTTAIDQLIKNIEAQIEKLQELRKIKIYEAVTGKLKVNAYAETTA